MINITDKVKCAGCNACGDICPVQAISFSADNEGFLYPHVDENKCTGCGLCEKICPCLNECGTKSSNNASPDCYAAEHKSVEVVFSSTSGGLFSALADITYNEKGFVGGAVHNEDFSVSNFISNDKNDLKRLRRSKDLQSNAEGFYKKTKQILDNGDRALVCGLPCQIAGLLNYLQKDYENLITVDLICAGVNSPKVWRKYLDYIEEINGSKIISTENKSKEYGWKNLTQKFVFENGEEYFDTYKTSWFIKGYIQSHLYCRPSCYECKFKGFPRVADITIGDYWGIEKHSNAHNSDMGTSVVFVNSKKGQEYFEKVKKRINFEATPLEWAVEGNPALVSPMTKYGGNRQEFFDDLEKMRFDEVVKKHGGEEKEKSSMRKAAGVMKRVIKITRLNPAALYQTLKLSGLKNLRNGKGIICTRGCQINVDRSAKLEFDGIFVFGQKDKFPRSRDESKLYIGKNATLKVLGDFVVDAGCEINIFDDAELIIHGGKNGFSDANKGLTIICGEKIEIMSDVGMGRDVTIRDTNGDHYMNTTGYRTSRPVVIGEKAWLCEDCTIMPGVKIGRSAVVAGCSLVTKSVPDHAMVMGNPAQVVQENVIWKM